MVGEGGVSTPWQKKFCGRTKIPQIGESQLRMFKSYDERRPKLHHASLEAGVRVPARPSSQYCNCTKCVKKPNKNLLKKNKKIKNYIYICQKIVTIGWRDFEKYVKSYTFYVVPNCCRTPIPKFHVFMLPLSLVTGPQKICTVTLKWATTKILFTFFKGFTGNKICSLACLTTKNEEILH